MNTIYTHLHALTTVRTEGEIFPSDILAKIVTSDMTGMSAQDYHLPKGEKLNEAINRSWNRMYGLWGKFQQQRARLTDTETGTSITRESLLLPLFVELGYGRLFQSKSEERTLAGKEYAISHMWHCSPIHLLGCGVDLERRTKGVRGAIHASPHSLVQDFLNNSARHVWGFCSNGLRLRILRDNVRFSRQAFIEFDMESMFEGEVFSDFVLLWLLCHQSRVESDNPNACWLETWVQEAQSQSVRALDGLRDGVQRAVEYLGQGFLEADNVTLKAQLENASLSRQDFFRHLLRLIYRLLFLFAAEDRHMLHHEHAPHEAKARYHAWYSTARLRRLAGSLAGTRHYDLYEGLKCLMRFLENEGCQELALTPLGSFLWSQEALSHIGSARLSNSHLLTAIRALAYTDTEHMRRPVDYKNIGARELGSIYESLLELHPELDVNSGHFALLSAAGNERKTTGSYYTPTSLIESLLDTALEPVIHAALSAARAEGNPERSLLNITICDPACGSGHFLIAAAHRLAKRLASVRTEDAEPSPEAIRTALRDVIGRCIYGVDSNPMAVELCKVGLWMEAMEAGKPLSFLDHHIRCGNSLIGTVPGLINDEILLPDTAFAKLKGDDSKACTALKRTNKQIQRTESSPLLAQQSVVKLSVIHNIAQGIEALPSDNIRDIKAKEQAFRDMQKSDAYRHSWLLSDLWCAAFVIHKYFPFKEKYPDIPEEIPYGITQRHLLDYGLEKRLDAKLQADVVQLAQDYQFFHWHLAFPDVFKKGGFDCILGNPPWERVKIQEKEWFAERDPRIASAANAAARQKLINALKSEEPHLYEEFQQDLRKAEGQSHFMRNSGRFPLCGRGDINVYTTFAETARTLINPEGRMGCVIPSGIASDDTTKFFFQDMVEKQSLVSLFDFENKGIFPAIDSRIKFCLLTCGNGAHPTAAKADFVFFAHRMEELQEPQRRFSLTLEDFALLNPNTRTCPTFRTKHDAELTKAIYRRVPVLIREARGEQAEENPWGIKFATLFHMSNDSHLFHTQEDLEQQGAILEGNIFMQEVRITRDDGTLYSAIEEYLPLYEAKMIHHYNHRWATYEGTTSRNATLSELQDPNFSVLPRYWVRKEEVSEKITRLGWEHEWFMGWRDIARSTDERTVVGGLFPLSAVNHKLPMCFISNSHYMYLSSIFLTYIADFIARYKVGGTSLTFFIIKQLPILLPDTCEQPCPWDTDNTLAAWLRPRLLELTYTAKDMEAFAWDCGYTGAPFPWDEERRFLLRAEIDAAFFHLYLPSNADGTWKKTDNESDAEFQSLCQCFPTPRHAVAHVMETFPIVKKRDMTSHGTYRTKETILAIYGEMQEAMRTCTVYSARLEGMEKPVTPQIVETPLPPYVPSDSDNSFPYWEREKRVFKGMMLLKCTMPDTSFDVRYRMMLLGTMPDLCRPFLSDDAWAAFTAALEQTDFATWDAASATVRHERFKHEFEPYDTHERAVEYVKQHADLQSVNIHGITHYLTEIIKKMDEERDAALKDNFASIDADQKATGMDDKRDIA